MDLAPEYIKHPDAHTSSEPHIVRTRPDHMSRKWPRSAAAQQSRRYPTATRSQYPLLTVALLVAMVGDVKSGPGQTERKGGLANERGGNA